MNDDESTNRESMQIVSEENTWRDALISSGNESLENSSGSLHSPEVTIADQSMNGNGSMTEQEAVDTNTKSNDVENLISENVPTSPNSHQFDQSGNDHSENQREINTTNQGVDSKKEKADIIDVETTELCELSNLEIVDDQCNETVGLNDPEHDTNMKSEEMANDSVEYTDNPESSETLVERTESNRVEILDSTPKESDISFEDLKTSGLSNESIGLNISPSNEPTFIETTSCQNDSSSSMANENHRSNLETSEETDVVTLDSERNPETVSNVAAAHGDGSTNDLEMGVSVDSPELNTEHDNANALGAIEVEATVENEESIEVEATMEKMHADTTEMGVNSHFKPISKSFEFVADDINQLIQKSVEIQNDVAKS